MQGNTDKVTGSMSKKGFSPKRIIKAPRKTEMCV